MAAAVSPQIQEDRGLAEWIATLPAREKDTLLARVASGEGAQVQAMLLRRFRAAGGSRPAASSRTAAELRQAAGDVRPRGSKPRHSTGERRRPARPPPGPPPTPGTLTARHPAGGPWQEAAALIETKRPRDYDLAVTLLRDLRALADRHDDSAAFTERFLELRARHQRKPSLLERFDKAGLPR